MRLNTLNREIQEQQEKLNALKKNQIEPFLTQKKNILSKIKEIEKFHDEVKVWLRPNITLQLKKKHFSVNCFFSYFSFVEKKDTYDNTEIEDRVKKQMILVQEKLKDINKKIQT